MPVGKLRHLKNRFPQNDKYSYDDDYFHKVAYAKGPFRVNALKGDDGLVIIL